MTLQLYLLSLVSAGSASPRFPGRQPGCWGGSRLWGQSSGVTGVPGVQESTQRSGKGQLCRRLVSGLWCHQRVSPAPGKGQQGHGGQDTLEESHISFLSKETLATARWIMYTSVLGLFLHPKEPSVAGATGPQGQRAKEGVGRRCHPVPEGLGAHLSCLGLPSHGIATARHEIVPALLQGQPGTISRRGKGRAGGPGGSVMLGRRSEESPGLQPRWGGWCEPKARGGSARVFHDPSSMGHPCQRQESR